MHAKLEKTREMRRKSVNAVCKPLAESRTHRTEKKPPREREREGVNHSSGEFLKVEEKTDIGPLETFETESGGKTVSLRQNNERPV